MNKQQAYETVRARLHEWQQSLAQVDEIRAKFGATETSGADSSPQPAYPIGADAVEEIRRSENRAVQKWEALQEAVNRWSGLVLKSRPPLQEVIKTLRAYMPTLEAEYYVTSMAVIGDYAKGEDYEAGELELMIDYKGPLGLKFYGMNDELSDLLGLQVNVVTKSVIVEREPHLLTGAVPV